MVLILHPPGFTLFAHGFSAPFTEEAESLLLTLDPELGYEMYFGQWNAS